jgi:hypothetical protein
MKQHLALLSSIVATFLVLARPALGAQKPLRGGGREGLEQKEETNGKNYHRVLARGPRGVPSIVEGRLGQIDLDVGASEDE